jgi:hypothetical protein
LLSLVGKTMERVIKSRIEAQVARKLCAAGWR